ncbi:MAG: type II toxin-antitoxin system RelE/ParE family toxin [Acidobacteria bacterium]|nr:type II toxin-antitoxin system RelE/ParE family toxin [Acidobacteriota bacterium]
MFTVRILKDASRELERLDQPVARRIVQRIRWLAENVETIKTEGLKGELAGLFKLREGDYRIIYEIVRKERLIIIHSIGHRSRIYKRK